MALHCEKKVENANTMERKFCGSQNNHSISQQYIFASAKTSPNNVEGILLAIITISMMNSSPLLNTVCIWEILQNIELLCKHAHNKW
jgi:hypothetical protein